MPNNTIFPDLHTKKCTLTALDVSLYAVFRRFLFSFQVAFLSGGSGEKQKRDQLTGCPPFINVNFFLSLSFQSRNMESML